MTRSNLNPFVSVSSSLRCIVQAAYIQRCSSASNLWKWFNGIPIYANQGRSSKSSRSKANMLRAIVATLCVVQCAAIVSPPARPRACRTAAPSMLRPYVGNNPPPTPSPDASVDGLASSTQSPPRCAGVRLPPPRPPAPAASVRSIAPPAPLLLARVPTFLILTRSPPALISSAHEHRFSSLGLLLLHVVRRTASPTRNRKRPAASPLRRSSLSPPPPPRPTHLCSAPRRG